MNPTADQNTLSAFIKRRHPDYARLIAHWEFLERTYYGGREWFDGNIFRYIKEGPTEFQARVERAYRFNHTREAVDLVQKYIFKSPIQRNYEDAPEQVKDFWASTTLSGLNIKQFMSLVSTLTSIFGRIWVFVDNNKANGVITRADEKAAGVKVYAYWVKPKDILDIGLGEDDGELEWVLVRETVRDDKDPIRSTGEVKEQFRLWTRQEWHLFDIIDGGARGPLVRHKGSGEHGLSVVPCFPADHVLGEHRYSAPGLIDDVAYLDRAVANYLSDLDAIIQDQTFSQLAMPAQNLLPGEDGYSKVLEMGTKRVFVYDGEGGAKPEYLSPDPRQAGIIVTVINKLINEIYHTIGLAGERTKEDNAVGIDNSSGVAKAYDFERVNSLLAAKADSLENVERKLIELVMKHHSAEAPVDLVKYPDTFDVRSLFDEFTIAETLGRIDAPEGVRREQMLQVIDKLFPRLARELREKLEAELKSWPPKVELTAGQPPSKFGPARRNPQTQKRQGQVTSETA